LRPGCAGEHIAASGPDVESSTSANAASENTERRGSRK
jgi:hypothetical protein